MNAKAHTAIDAIQDALYESIVNQGDPSPIDAHQALRITEATLRGLVEYSEDKQPLSVWKNLVESKNLVTTILDHADKQKGGRR